MLQHKPIVSALTLLMSLLALMTPGWALVKMDSETINQAIIYGMKSKGMGYASLLGSNWIEGENGSLLNVYTPFMLLANQAYKGNFPKNPKKEDVQKARKTLGKWVAHMNDPKNKLQIKFAVNFYGDTPAFAKPYTARIEGFGRGKSFNLQPVKQYRQGSASLVSSSQGPAAYEAINTYYFRFSDLEELQEYKLILESPAGPPLTFRLKNDSLY